MGSTDTPYQPQLIILGGGIAGLWLLNRLCNSGYDAILLEKGELGQGQTLASQGIIHGGLKYALNGVLSQASSAIADMPQRWRDCLEGRGDVDLRGCRVLSPHYYMWSGSGYRSRLKTFLGSKALRGRIDQLPAAEYPDFFRNADGKASKGSLYQLTDFVVDTPSLLQLLAQRWQNRIFHASDIQLQANGEKSVITSLTATDETGASISLQAERYLFCAGEGNEALLQQAGIAQPAMQRRPLHMVWVKTNHPHPAFVHCIGDSFGMTPRLTITSHPEPKQSDYLWTWYLGGEIAESGVDRDQDSQIAAARKLLSDQFPWVDLTDTSWGSFFINRAEPQVPSLHRPDTAWLSASSNHLIAWPTKLTLSPNLGDAALHELEKQKILPAHKTVEIMLESDPSASIPLTSAAMAAARWQE